MSEDPRKLASGKSGRLIRRGLLAGTAAVAAGAVARLFGTERAEATHGGGTDPTALHVAQTNTTAAGETRLNVNGPGGVTGFRVDNNAGGAAIHGSGTNLYGVFGGSVSNAGVFGSSSNDLGGYFSSGGGAGVGVGVWGDCSAGVGVTGRATGSGTGVKGQSSTGFGVQGTSDSNAGIFGSSNSNIAVYGQSAGGPGAGSGVFGDCGTGVGVQGRSTAGGTGVIGQSATGTAIHGITTTGIAGRFEGDLLVTGDLKVDGQKSAIVPLSDGTMRRLYCMESPESWFEDFGEATLTGGGADVPLEPGFAATVLTERYQVFLTEYGDSGGLFVTSRTPRGFRVQARNGSSTAAFGYRVVAKRKDVKGERLEKVEVPQKRNDGNRGNGVGARGVTAPTAPESVPVTPNIKLPPAERTQVPKPLER